MAKETIYLGKVVDTDRYAVWHDAPAHQSSDLNSHFNFDMSFDQMAAYIEGATAHQFSGISIVNNGIPQAVRGRSNEEIRTERLTPDSLDELIRDSGLLLGGKHQVMTITTE